MTVAKGNLKGFISLVEAKTLKFIDDPAVAGEFTAVAEEILEPPIVELADCVD